MQGCTKGPLNVVATEANPRTEWKPEDVGDDRTTARLTRKSE